MPPQAERPGRQTNTPLHEAAEGPQREAEGHGARDELQAVGAGGEAVARDDAEGAVERVEHVRQEGEADHEAREA